MLADLPVVADAYETGGVGSDQVRLLGRASANVRVRDKVVTDQDWFLKHADRNRFGDFKRVMTAWVERSDENGAEPIGRAHENRNASLVQDYDKTWTFEGSCSALTGASMAEIFDKYVAAELMADWEKARAEFGDAACADNLARTGTQRRADALWQIFQDAANSPHRARADRVPTHHRVEPGNVRRRTDETGRRQARSVTSRSVPLRNNQRCRSRTHRGTRQQSGVRGAPGSD